MRWSFELTAPPEPLRPLRIERATLRADRFAPAKAAEQQFDEAVVSRRGFAFAAEPLKRLRSSAGRLHRLERRYQHAIIEPRSRAAGEPRLGAAEKAQIHRDLPKGEG